MANLTGAQVNAVFERGLLGRHRVAGLQFPPVIGDMTPWGNFVPRPVKRDGAPAGEEPAHVVKLSAKVGADFDAVTRRLVLTRDENGHGYWLPFVDGYHGRDVKVATYTPDVRPGDGISWVVTGPFSGCRAATFAQGVSRVFAHLVTGEHAGALDVQVDAIQRATLSHLQESRPIRARGAAATYVLWTLLDRAWWRRDFALTAGVVTQVDRKALVR